MANNEAWNLGSMNTQRKHTGPLTTTGVKKIRETDLGVYVWKRAENGKILADEHGNPLNIPSEFGDIAKMAELQRVAKAVCINNDLTWEGQAVFWDVHRCTDEEYAEQVYLMDNGILSDTNIRRKK